MILSPDPSCSSLRCFKSFKKEFCTSDPFRADRNRSPSIVISASTMFRGKEDMLMLDSGHCYEKLVAREYGKGKLQTLEEAGKTCMSVQTHTPKRKRNLPGNPDPDAEVVALSPKSLMATNRFVCEICSKGFQRDQNLQLHRRGHNLPWKLKQKSSTEMKKRVYICPEPSCVHHDSSRALGDLTGIKKHYSRKHGEKKWKCDKCSKQYAVHSDWKAHSKACGSREYRCNCGTLFSRRDSFVTHRAFCDALAQETARISANLHGVVNDILGNEQGIIISASNGNPSSSSPTRAGHHHHHLGSWSHPHTNDNNNVQFSSSSFISQQQVEGGIRMGFQENDLIPAWDSQTRPGSGVFSWPPPPPMEESTDDISPFHFVSPNIFFDSYFYEGDKTVVGGGKHSASRLASEFGVNSAGLSLSFNDCAMNGPKDHHSRNNSINNNTNSIDSAYYDVPLSLRRYGMAADLESSHLHPPLCKPGGILSPPFNPGPSSSSSSTLTDFIPCSSFESSQQPMTATAAAVQQFMNSFSSSSADMNIPQSKLLLNPTQKKQGLLEHPSISPTSLQNATTLKPPSNLGWELEVPHHSRLTRDFLGVDARTLSQSQPKKLRSRMEM